MSETTQVSVSLPTKAVEAIDAICDEYGLARSRVIRDVLGKHIEDGEFAAAVEDVIPDETLLLAERESLEDAMLDRQKLREKKHSHADRVKGYLAKRMEGHEAYDPDGIRDLATGYKQDATIWFDDEDAIEQRHAEVDDWVEWYELGYWARQHADAVETKINRDDVSDGWFEIGEHLHILRERLDDVTETIETIANTQGVGWDSDAVIDAVARKYSVHDGAVRLLIEFMIDEPETSLQEALALGGDRLQVAGNGHPALQGPVDDVDEIPGDAVVTRGGQAVDIDAITTDGGEIDDLDVEEEQ